MFKERVQEGGGETMERKRVFSTLTGGESGEEYWGLPGREERKRGGEQGRRAIKRGNKS